MLLTGTWEEKEGESTIVLWEEEAACQIEGESWEGCRGEAWFPNWNPCSC